MLAITTVQTGQEKGSGKEQKSLLSHHVCGLYITLHSAWRLELMERDGKSPLLFDLWAWV